jgi:hypothetical protein
MPSTLKVYDGSITGYVGEMNVAAEDEIDHDPVAMASHSSTGAIWAASWEHEVQRYI